MGALQNYFADFFRQGAGVGVILLPKIKDEIGGYISLLYGTPVTLTPQKNHPERLKVFFIASNWTNNVVWHQIGLKMDQRGLRMGQKETTK